jgi:hypothetical protein
MTVLKVTWLNVYVYSRQLKGLVRLWFYTTYRRVGWKRLQT